MAHATLDHLLEPLRVLKEQVREKAVLRLKYENLEAAPELTTVGTEWYQNPAGWAMHKFAYYLCFKCQKAYFGGGAECAAAGGADFDPSELMCGSCAPSSAKDCPKHGRDYLEFKVCAYG
jgi:E3 ubiquitin-protein ligase MYCBP2